MPLKLNVTGDAQAFKLDFNKAAGIKALDVKNKFIGVDTKEKSFQALFKSYPKVQKVFRNGYSEEFSKEFSVGRVSVEASGELILARIYAKLGLMIESAGYDLGGVTIGSKQAGSFDLLASTPTSGNGFSLSTKTVSALGGVPSLSATLPNAYLKAKLLGDVDIGALAFDGRLKGSIKRIGSKTVDLPRFGVLSGIKTQPPISIPLVDFSVPKVLNGQATGIYGKKQKKKGILEAEYEGIKIASDLRKFANGLKVSNGTLSGEFPIFTMSSSLNKLGAKAAPQLNLLAKRIEGKGYDINYKLLDFSVGSDLKLKYSGRIQLVGQRSSATFENGRSVNLSGASNGFSDSVGLLNTTELKKLLDANGDGKATVRFDQAINQANFVLEYGLYANLVSTLEVGKFNASIGAEINFPAKKISAGTDLVDISLYKKQKLQLLKDFKVVGGSKTISLPTNNYQFSKTVEFSVPTNADDLISILGLDPNAFYTVKGTNSNDNLFARTEQGNDTLIGGLGADTMSGGRGDDTYIIDSTSDLVIEDISSGYDSVVVSSEFKDLTSSMTVSNNVEVIDFRPYNNSVSVKGNSLNNIIYGPSVLVSTYSSYFEGGDGNDTLIGSNGLNSMLGGNGDDVLIAGIGQAAGYGNSDYLIGGSGRDTFVFGANNRTDTIGDFDAAQDVIQVASGIGFTNSEQLLFQFRSGRLILGSGNEVYITITNGSLTTANFKIG